MANNDHLEIIRRGPDTWDDWRSQNPSIKPDLSRADLRGADLTGTALYGTNLSNAILSRARLSGALLSRTDLKKAYLSDANLSGADLIEANLSGASLDSANLYGAELCRADLRETQLYGTNLARADLADADLTGAFFLETILGGTNLRGAKGLDLCWVQGPCTIDFRTIQRSGHLPLSFLRGCGLADTHIDNHLSLLNQPLQYHSCCISYSTKDDEFAQRLHADLQNNGVRCWFAPHDIEGGKKIHEQISEAIRRYERLLLILSEHSMESDWVATEIANAREREATENRQVLFPIRLVDYARIQAWKCFDGDRGKDSAREIREYFIPDFTHWKDHDAYTESFERLLKDLKPETRKSE